MSFTDKTTLIQWKLAWSIATTSRCLFEFFRGLAFVRSSLQRIFLTADFCSKRTYSNTYRKVSAGRSPTGERGAWAPGGIKPRFTGGKNCPTLCEEKKSGLRTYTLCERYNVVAEGTCQAPQRPGPAGAHSLCSSCLMLQEWNICITL